MKSRFTVPIPLPHEADGLASLFVGFHGTNNIAGYSVYEKQAVDSRASVWRRQLRVCQGLLGILDYKRGCSKGKQ